MDQITTIKFRSEQEEAIALTVKTFKRGHRMLWNAKMRFGKTLCALEVARRLGYRRTLILTHRPAVRKEWFNSIEKLGIGSWLYGSKTRHSQSKIEKKRAGETFASLESKAQKDSSVHYIYFASMQDLRGSRRVKGEKGADKNDDIFSAKWDLLIIDEAHEGITTKLGRDVIGELQKNHSIRTLYLSGTPYNIQSLFDATEVYHWDYIMEQKAKEQYAMCHSDATNPYGALARMNIDTYNTAKDFRKYYAEDGSFNFAEFLRTEENTDSAESTTSVFVHENDVRKFLKNYASKILAQKLDHTLWYLPSVSSAQCLARIIKEDDAENPLREYFVVNVAGNNDPADINDISRREYDAAEKVRSAVSANKRTITLTCGRLTMGVSIPEWTGVFMLAGGLDTSAMRYFQTIFRCQSPLATGQGTKKECYAIDFSPKRTITVVDQYINNNANAGETRQQQLEAFLHYCPVTEVTGTKRSTYTPETFINAVNSTYSDRLIRGGFRDSCLYSNLDNLRSQDIRLLDQVAEAIFRGIVAERVKTREEMSTKNSQSKTKKKTKQEGKELSQKEQAALDSMKEATHKLTPRQRALAILNQISARFPMMIYGAVDRIEGLTLDSFVNQIDADSWRDFMPSGVTPKLFQRLKRFYREDIFVATAKAIMARLRHADAMAPTQRVEAIAGIISDFCYPDRETVLTPWQVVNRQLSDTLGGYCFYSEKFDKPIKEARFVYHGDVTNRTFSNPESRILDIYSKTGLYSLYAAYSMFKLRSSQSQGLFDLFSEQESDELWKDVVANNIFAVCRTRMAKFITRRTLLGFDSEAKANICCIPDIISQVMVYRKKLIRTISDGKDFWKTNNNKEMKFDAIICNPPYQVNVGGQKDNYGIPLYNQFVDLARDMKPNYISMIMPSRWFTGGRGLDKFRQTMLTDRRLRVICDFVDSKDLFPTVDISGGVDYFLWDAQNKKQCKFTNTLHGISNTCERKLDQFPIFVRNNEALSFINKVVGKSKSMLNTQVSGQTPFGFVSTFRGKANPKIDKDTIELKSSGTVSYVTRSDVKKNTQWIDMYKIVFSKATCEHAGTPDRNGQFRVLSSVAMLPPGVVCTQSYLVGGAFATETEARNFQSYLCTKFARYLMLQTITSQDLSPDKFIFVPAEDYTGNGDIKWTTDNIGNIDQQLYAKYKISKGEISAVENTIKEMDF